MDMFWPFRSTATSSFDRIYPGSKHFVGSGCWPNCVSQCCLLLVSLTVPKHLDSCSTFHKADVTSRALFSPLFLGFRCWLPLRPIHPMCNRSPQWKCWCYLEVFSWTLCFITKKKRAESSKILNLFIQAPLRELMIIDISLYWVVSQRPLYGTLVRLPRTISLLFPFSRRTMIVLRRSL